MTVHPSPSPRFDIGINIHGYHLRFTTNSAFLKEEFLADFAFFKEENVIIPDLTSYLIVEERTTFSYPLNAKVLYGPSDVFFFRDEYLYVKTNDEKAYGEVNTKTGEIIVRGEETRVYSMFRNILIAFLSALLEKRGIVRIHGACLALNRRGVIFANVSSGGKTTTCYHLIRDGFQYLADDASLIGIENRKLILLAYPTRLGVDKKMLETFSFHGKTYRRVIEGTREKWLVPASDLFPCEIIKKCDLFSLAFISLWTGKETNCKEMNRKEVFSIISLLIRESPFHQFPHLGNRSRERFLTVWNVLRNVRCYKICIGTDPTNLVKTIRELLHLYPNNDIR